MSGATLDLALAQKQSAALRAGLLVAEPKRGYCVLCCLSTGRMCCCRKTRCDRTACGCSSKSDFSQAGSEVVYYFMFAKALAWIFALCALVTLPNVVMMGRASGAALEIGLGQLSRLTLGQMPLTGDVHWSASGQAGTVNLTLSRSQIPALYSILEMSAMALLAVSLLYMLAYMRIAQREIAAACVGVEDYSIVVTGFQPVCRCAATGCCGCCGEVPVTSTELGDHFTRIADVFTPLDYGASPGSGGGSNGSGRTDIIACLPSSAAAGGSHQEVHCAGAELSLVRALGLRTGLLLKIAAMEHARRDCPAPAPAPVRIPKQLRPQQQQQQLKQQPIVAKKKKAMATTAGPAAAAQQKQQLLGSSSSSTAAHRRLATSSSSSSAASGGVLGGDSTASASDPFNSAISSATPAYSSGSDAFHVRPVESTNAAYAASVAVGDNSINGGGVGGPALVLDAAPSASSSSSAPSSVLLLDAAAPLSAPSSSSAAAASAALDEYGIPSVAADDDAGDDDEAAHLNSETGLLRVWAAPAGGLPSLIRAATNARLMVSMREMQDELHDGGSSCSSKGIAAKKTPARPAPIVATANAAVASAPAFVPQQAVAPAPAPAPPPSVSTTTAATTAAVVAGVPLPMLPTASGVAHDNGGEAEVVEEEEEEEPVAVAVYALQQQREDDEWDGETPPYRRVPGFLEHTGAIDASDVLDSDDWVPGGRCQFCCGCIYALTCRPGICARKPKEQLLLESIESLRARVAAIDVRLAPKLARYTQIAAAGSSAAAASLRARNVNSQAALHPAVAAVLQTGAAKASSSVSSSPSKAGGGYGAHEHALQRQSSVSGVRTGAGERPIAAYITFRSADVATRIVRLYDMSGPEWCLRRGRMRLKAREGYVAPQSAPGCCCGRASSGGKATTEAVVPLGLRGRTRLHVARAPPPDTILFENLTASAGSRCVRLSLTTLLSAALVAISFALLYGANVANNSARTITLAPLSGTGVNGSSAPILDACVLVDGMWGIGAQGTTGSGSLVLNSDTYAAFSPANAAGLGYAATDFRSLSTLYVPAVLSLVVSANESTALPDAACALASNDTVAAGVLANSTDWAWLASSVSSVAALVNGTIANATNASLVGGALPTSVAAYPWSAMPFVPASSLLSANCSGSGGNHVGDAVAPAFSAAALGALSGSGTDVLLPASSGLVACYCQGILLSDPASLLNVGAALSRTLASAKGTVAGWLNAAGVSLRWVGPPGSSSNATTSLLSAAVPMNNFDACDSWLGAYLLYISILILALITQQCVNLGLGGCLARLSVFERHATTTAAKRSLMLRMFILQFFNTGILTVALTAVVPGGPINTAGGKYPDFDPAWYSTQAVAITLTMVIQGLLPPTVDLAYAGWWSLRRCLCSRKGGAKYQAALVQYWLTPQFSVAARYAQLLSLSFVCLMYSTGIPILYFILALSVMYRYGVDVLLFLFFYSRPPREESVVLGHDATLLLPLAVVIHLLVGAWMLSGLSILITSGGATIGNYGLIPSQFTPPSLQSLSFWTEIGTDAALQLADSPDYNSAILSRLTTAYVLPLVVFASLLLIIIAAIALWTFVVAPAIRIVYVLAAEPIRAVVAGALRCCCGCCCEVEDLAAEPGAACGCGGGGRRGGRRAPLKWVPRDKADKILTAEAAAALRAAKAKALSAASSSEDGNGAPPSTLGALSGLWDRGVPPNDAVLYAAAAALAAAASGDGGAGGAAAHKGCCGLTATPGSCCAPDIPGDVSADGTSRLIRLPPYETAVEMALFSQSGNAQEGTPETYNYLGSASVSNALFGEPRAPYSAAFDTLADGELLGLLHVGDYEGQGELVVKEKRRKRGERYRLRSLGLSGGSLPPPALRSQQRSTVAAAESSKKWGAGASRGSATSAAASSRSGGGTGADSDDEEGGSVSRASHNNPRVSEVDAPRPRPSPHRRPVSQSATSTSVRGGAIAEGAGVASPSGHAPTRSVGFELDGPLPDGVSTRPPRPAASAAAAPGPRGSEASRWGPAEGVYNDYDDDVEDAPPPPYNGVEGAFR